MTSQVHLSLDVSHDSDSLDCQSASEFSQAWQRFPEKSAQSMSARILASGHGPSYSPRKPDTMKGAHLIDGGWASWREKKLLKKQTKIEALPPKPVGHEKWTWWSTWPACQWALPQTCCVVAVAGHQTEEGVLVRSNELCHWWQWNNETDEVLPCRPEFSHNNTYTVSKKQFNVSMRLSEMSFISLTSWSTMVSSVSPALLAISHANWEKHVNVFDWACTNTSVVVSRVIIHGTAWLFSPCATPTNEGKR